MTSPVSSSQGGGRIRKRRRHGLCVAPARSGPRNPNPNSRSIKASPREREGSLAQSTIAPLVARALSLSLHRGGQSRMSLQIYRSAARTARALLSASRSSSFLHGRALAAAAAAAAAATSFRGKTTFVSSFYERAGSGGRSGVWVSSALALPAAVYMLQDQEVHAAEMERSFIAIKPDGVQRGLIAEIISRFECKGYKLVAIKLVVPSKEFAQKHYHDLKERPFFDGLCSFLSSGPVVAMVWEGEGVIKYGRKLIGATDPQKSEPGTIRGDLAVVVGRNIIHGSDGPETAKDEISLWFEPSELVSYTSNAEKWVYDVN